MHGDRDLGSIGRGGKRLRGSLCGGFWGAEEDGGVEQIGRGEAKRENSSASRAVSAIDGDSQVTAPGQTI